MKKKIQVLSMILVLTLLISVFGNSVAFAADTEATEITFSDEFSSLETLELNSIYYSYEVGVNKPELTLTAVSSDTSIIDIQKETDNSDPGVYYYDLAACGNGEATLTFTASDGTSVTKTLTVEGTGEIPYTITSDTNQDFSLAKGSSKLIKIHFDQNDSDLYSFPLLFAKDEKAIKTTLVDSDEENGDYTYRVDVTGSVGQTCDLYMGAYGYIPNKLCTVTLTENKDLRLDTDSEYICNAGETYRFVAYTGSATAPTVSTSNSGVSAAYIGKVTGGYEYRIKALEPGSSLVMVELNGEKASFPVTVNEEGEFPDVSTNDSDSITLAQGDSYTYKLTILGGGEPKVVAGIGNVVSVQMVKKDGADYSFKVTAVGQANSQTGLYVTFPESTYDSDYSYNFGSVTVKEGSSAPKSDTNTDFSLKQGASYTFKISNAASFYPGSNSVFKTEKVGTSGSDAYYKITATGNPGQSAGFYMAAAGQAAQKVCVVSIAAAAPPKSDTNTDFSLKQGASYTFKISNAASFYPGSNSVFKTEKVGTSGSDAYYKVTAIGQPGQSAGFYMAAAGQAAQKVCVITVGAAPAPKSDTNVDFTLKQNASYTFKISNAASFYPGSNSVFKTEKVGTSGSDTYYKITAIGQPGQSAGFYMAAAGQAAQKVCVVTVGAPAAITIQSDTNTDFGIAKNASYQFKITAPGVTTVNFSTGTGGVFQVTFLRHTGDDFFYKITAIGKTGQKSGIYVSLPAQPAQKLCVVSIS